MNHMRFRQLIFIPGILLLVLLFGGFSAVAAPPLRILVIGSSNPLENEAAFPAAPVQAELQSILARDPNFSGRQITVQAQDTYKTLVSGDFTFSSRSLMSWFYWPVNGAHAQTLALLGQG